MTEQVNQTTEKAIRNNRLTDTQKFTVAKWLWKNEEWLKHEGPSFPTVAEKATAELGFKLTATNIQTLAESIPVTWETKQQTTARRTGNAYTVLDERLKALEAENALLRGRLDSVEGMEGLFSNGLKAVEAHADRLQIAVNHICASQGITPPSSAGVPLMTNTKKLTVNNQK